MRILLCGKEGEGVEAEPDFGDEAAHEGVVWLLLLV